MRTYLAAAALVTAFASPALAQTMAVPADVVYAQYWQGEAPLVVQYQPRRRAYRAYRGYRAYGWDRNYDPDPWIRDYLKFDPPTRFR